MTLMAAMGSKRILGVVRSRSRVHVTVGFLAQIDQIRSPRSNELQAAVEHHVMYITQSSLAEAVDIAGWHVLPSLQRFFKKTAHQAMIVLATFPAQTWTSIDLVMQTTATSHQPPPSPSRSPFTQLHR
jgi:hypothetical protein